MSIIDTFVENTQYVEDLSTRVVAIQNTLDFDKTNVSAADVVECLKIPADMLVTNVSTYVITADGETCTATLGDGDGAAEWKDSINLNSTGGYYAVSGTDDYSEGKYYSANDTIDLTMGHDTEDAKIHIIATGVNATADLA